MYTSELSKKQALAMLYKQLHQQYKHQDKHNISLNENYGTVFERKERIQMEGKPYDAKELLYYIIDDNYTHAFYN